MPVDIRVVGSVEAYTTIEVKAQVGGQLMKVQFREGDNVREGELLFVIDPRPFDEAIRQAKANLERDTAMLRQAEANLQRDLAQEKFAREQAARYEKLFREGVMSKQQTDQFMTEADVRAQAVRADQAAIESARAAIAADEAALSNTQLQRSYCTIRSPISGRTGDLAVQQGNLVKANDTELLTIHQIQPILVTFSVPEKDLPDIKQRMAARKLSVLVNPAAAPDQVDEGDLTFIDNAVDTTTGSIKLKATFKNPGSSLWPGQFVNVVLRLDTVPNAVVVPVLAIQTSQTGEYVYVVKPDMTAEMRPVTTGLRVRQEIVIEKGLKTGETVVTEGQLRLAPGIKVRTRQAQGE
jgi:multidrug efflux system membrane fusion protein